MIFLHRVHCKNTEELKASKKKTEQKDRGGESLNASQNLVQGAQTPAVLGSWCICPFVSGQKPRTPSLEHALQHGRGVGGPRLPALYGAAEILDPAATLPNLLELPGEDLGSPLPRQARLLQAQLAHLHVVLSWNETDGLRFGLQTRRVELTAVWG